MKKEYVYTVLSIIFMSAGPTINKFALTNISAFTLVLYNSFLCCLFVAPFILKKISSISREEIKYLSIAGILNAISLFFLFYGLSRSSPALVSMLNRSYIIFSIIIGALILKEHISNVDYGLIIFVIIGMCLFMFKKEMAKIQIDALYGLISGLLFSLCNLTIKHKLSRTCPYLTLFFVNLISTLLFFFVCLFIGHKSLTIPFEAKTMSFVFLGSFLGSFLGLLFFYNSLKTIPFYKANLYRSISPVVSLLLAYLFFPTSLSFVNILGLVILLLSIVIHSYIKATAMKKNEIEIIKTEIVPEAYKSVLVFIKEGNQWLMVKNKFRNWEFPGGHKELNETKFQTAKREAFEEAGIDICDLQYVGYYRLPSGHTTLMITAKIEKYYNIPEEFETVERKFVSELPSSLSFNDAVYPWLIKNL